MADETIAADGTGPDDAVSGHVPSTGAAISTVHLTWATTRTPAAVSSTASKPVMGSALGAGGRRRRGA